MGLLWSLTKDVGVWLGPRRESPAPPPLAWHLWACAPTCPPLWTSVTPHKYYSLPACTLNLLTRFYLPLDYQEKLVILIMSYYLPKAFISQSIEINPESCCLSLVSSVTSLLPWPLSLVGIKVEYTSYWCQLCQSRSYWDALSSGKLGLLELWEHTLGHALGFVLVPAFWLSSSFQKVPLEAEPGTLWEQVFPFCRKSGCTKYSLQTVPPVWH